MRFQPINQAWLDLHVEEVVEPELSIVDSHHHVWDGERGRYLLDDLFADLNSGHDIRATVFVECHSMYRTNGPAELRRIGETEYIMELAARCEASARFDTQFAAGIVGSLDLTLGKRNAAVLDAHLDAAGDRFKGVRGATAWHEDSFIRNQATTAKMFALASVRESVVAVAARGLVLDVWMFHTQLGELSDICRQFPSLKIIVDHAGGPVSIGPYEGRRWEVFVEWRRRLTALAQYPNVFMKLGGLGMRYSGFDFHALEGPPSSDVVAASWRPYFETCIELFGARRCMFESNFPVDKAMMSYRTLWNAMKKVSRQYAADERRALFHATARDAYRLTI